MTRGYEYEVNGVKFDGYDNGTLIDAKDDYLSFIDETGNWRPLFRSPRGSRPSGYQGVLDEANRQRRGIR